MNIFTDTGFGSCLLIIVLLVGIPLAWRHDAKKKPEGATSGQNINN